MYYPSVEENYNSRSMIDTWLGYNHNYRIGSGEFYDMLNLTSDYFPLLTPRKLRPLLVDLKEDEDQIFGLLYSDNNIAYLQGTTLYYSLLRYDLSDYMEYPTEWQTLLRFGSYILIYPANVYINVNDPTDVGTMTDTFIADIGTEVTYSICNAEGDGYDHITASDESPESPSNGDYWLKTSDIQGLYIYDGTQKTWLPVATSYIRVSLNGAKFADHFSEGDTVTMNTQLGEVNKGSTIQAIADDYFVVIGFMPTVSRTEQNTSAWQFRVDRKLPYLDYVCTDKNRVWGCHYGYDNGKFINEIYASKLGDFKNWYTYSGISTDSYAATVGAAGEWTGCISYNGYPTFFKDNAIIRVFGSMPSQYQITQSDQRGVQKGSHRSLAIVDEYLVYKSTTDICAYDGSSPVSISEALGRDELYYDAVGGGCLNKYRVVMENSKGAKIHLVYDFKTSLWMKEDNLPFKCFSATENGQLYGATPTQIYGLGNTDNIAFTNKEVGEEWVEWFAQSGEIGFEYPDYKYVSRITLRAFVPSHSELQLQISYDDRPFETVGTIRGDSSIATQSIAFAPFRCDHYRIKLSGHGDVRIYTMATTFDTGAEDDGCSYR